MSQPTSQWQWDSTARLWYYFDHRVGYEVFETGAPRSQAQQPRSFPSGSRDPPSTTQYSSSPTAQTAAYNVRRDAGLSASGNASSNAGRAAQGKRPEARYGQSGSTQDPLVHDFANATISGNSRPPLNNQTRDTNAIIGGQPRTPLNNQTREWTDENGDRFVQVTNPVSQVQTSLKTGPANRITDPTLFQQGIRATQMLLPTHGQTEKLFDEYKRREQPRRFFTKGKVFRVLWSEPAGENRTAVTFEAPGVTTGKFGERVHSKVRLFVVIREADTYCSALPILSYGNQGVSKGGVDKSEHSIIYSGKTPPQPFDDEAPRRGEQGMRPDAIRVNPDDRADQLHPRSRIDYGKVYTIEHNIKVKPYGQVHPGSEAALRHQFLNVWLGENAASAVARSSTDSSNANNSAAAQPREQRPSRRASHSTHTTADSGNQGQAGGSNAAATFQAHAKAAVERLVGRGFTQEEATQIVRLVHGGKTQEEAIRVVSAARSRTGPSTASDHGDEDSDDGNESESDEDEDDEDNTRRAPSSGHHRVMKSSSRPIGIPQQHGHHPPPRLDSVPQNQPPPRRQGASIPSTGTRVTQPTSTSASAPSASRPPAQAQSHAQSEVPPRANARSQPQAIQNPRSPAQSTSQSAALYQRLLDAGYTPEQARKYIQDTYAKQRG